MNFEDQTNNSILNFENLISIIRERLVFIFVSSLFLMILFFLFSLFIPNHYKSESLLSVSNENLNDSNPGLSELAGIAASFGVGEALSGDEKADLAIAISTSRSFLEILIKKYEWILPSLMAPKKFNSFENKLEFNESLYDSKQKKWVRQSFFSKKEKPTYLDAHEVFIKEVFNISKNKLTGHVKMSAEHISPVFSKNLLEVIINEINQISRARDKESAEKAISFLQKESAKNSLDFLNKSISKLIEKQIEVKMMTEISDEYLLEIIDKPFIPEKKSYPSRLSLGIFGFLIGLIISIVWAIYFSSKNKS